MTLFRPTVEEVREWLENLVDATALEAAGRIEDEDDGLERHAMARRREAAEARREDYEVEKETDEPERLDLKREEALRKSGHRE